tara:strand:+ start:186 stop:1046 length:861 start_codon:yes stop_codon:yes gene_type:complete
MDTAIVIPIHSPKFYFANTLLQSIKKYDIKTNLFLVFSSSFEKLIFDIFYPYNKYYPLIHPSSSLDPKGIINQKKFSALQAIYSSYPEIKYIAVLDCEAIVNKRFSPSDSFSSIFNSSFVKANTSDEGGRIIRHIANLLKLNIDYEKIQSKTNDFTLFWWFNELCIYERSSFLDFFNWLVKLPQYSLIASDYWCFDYLLYTIYLIDNDIFRIKQITPLEEVFNFGALEQNFDDRISILFSSAVDRNPNAKKFPFNFITFQLDYDIDAYKLSYRVKQKIIKFLTKIF